MVRLTFLSLVCLATVAGSVALSQDPADSRPPPSTPNYSETKYSVARDATGAGWDVRPTPMTVEAVGSEAHPMGVVTPWGAFDLEVGNCQGMLLVQGDFPLDNFFDRVTLAYMREYRDRSSNVAGSLYKATFSDSKFVYFLFGNKDVGTTPQGVRQRYVMYYQSNGTKMGPVIANVAPPYSRITYETSHQRPPR